MTEVLEKDKVNTRYQYLRPKKAEYLRQWYRDTFEERDALYAYTYDDAIILPLKSIKGDNLLFGRGGVIDKHLNYVDVSAIDRRIQLGYEVTELDRQNKKVVYCGYLVDQWGHFLVEAVARLWYFLENDDETIDKYVFFTEYGRERQLKGNYEEFFKLLGIYSRIEIINKPTKYNCVIVPELAYKWRSYYSQSFKAIFDRIVHNVKPRPEWIKHEKIFFTRSEIKNISKKEFGLDMLDDYFRRNGYTIISPEKISLSYLIYLIRYSEICSTLSGSLAHNMLFAEDGKKLIIIERNVLNNEIQVDINRMKKFSFIYIDANIGIYPVKIGYGPFIMTYLGRLEQFSKDFNYVSPNRKYLTKRYLKHCFKQYMKEYRRVWGYQWLMEEWQYQYTDYIKEAYNESLQWYGDYINGKKPFALNQLFSLSNINKYIRRYVREMFKR